MTGEHRLDDESTPEAVLCGLRTSGRGPVDDPLEALLARQARRWEIEAGAGMPRPRGPVVACSRWDGAEGEAVAAQVAEWLDYGFFGPEAIDRIGADAAWRARLAEGLDATRRKALADLVAAAIERAPGAPRELVEVVATLGARGMAVVLGRGAAAILPPDRALRVLVVAPTPLRVDRVAAARKIPRPEAEACVRSADAARRAALAERFGIASEDLTHYDLVLNTEALSVESAAALAVDALRRRFPL
jgi:cytidylate kinase